MHKQDGEPKLLLDLGCGSGLSGEALSEAGHAWVVSESDYCALQGGEGGGQRGRGRAAAAA